MYAITKVFKAVGDEKSIQDTYDSLLDYYKNEMYPDKKASGSIGGAVSGGTIVLNNGFYRRIK